jgi:hypothetical protein
MAPPRDRLQNLQAQAYFGDDDEYTIPIDEDDHGPMQKFFREIEDLREVVNLIEKVKKELNLRLVFSKFMFQCWIKKTCWLN